MDTITLAESEGEVVGFFSLVGSELDALFVTPEAIGQGFGASLLKAALSQARAQGIEAIEFDADPQAVPFYARFRAVVVGESPSTSIAGRSLPRMRIATTL
jgi:GNAT superfamily N-acetyltransferase